MILSIDPGNTDSAYVILNNDLRPIEFGKKDNESILSMIHGNNVLNAVDHAVIEGVASYGMPVGAEVFETVFWSGRFWEEMRNINNKKLIYRKDVKMNLCHNMRAKDTNIIMALVDRFAKHDLKTGKGTKKDPDWFHGFSGDVWQAYAAGITYHDLYLKKS